MENRSGETKKCSRCQRVLPATDFARNAAAKDGLQNYCRDCSASWARDHRPRKLTEPPDVEEGMKWCRRCETVKPVEAFAVHRKLKDGRQVHCRDCQAAAYRAKRQDAGHVVKPADVPEGFRFCRACQTVKPLDEWSTSAHTTTGYRSSCKDCTAARARKDHLKRTYGLTEDDVATMLEKQGGVCAVYETAEPVHIDHDHTTGTVRGLLCFRCNAAIGQLDEKPQVLLNAALYLLAATRSRVPSDLVWARHITQASYRPTA